MAFIKLLYTPVECHGYLVTCGYHFVISLGLGLASVWVIADASICVQWLCAWLRALCYEMCAHCWLLRMFCDSILKNSPFLFFVPPESFWEAWSLYFFPGVLCRPTLRKKDSLDIVFQLSNQEVKRKGKFKWCQVSMLVWFSSQHNYYFHNTAGI